MLNLRQVVATVLRTGWNAQEYDVMLKRVDVESAIRSCEEDRSLYVDWDREVIRLTDKGRFEGREDLEKSGIPFDTWDFKDLCSKMMMLRTPPSLKRGCSATLFVMLVLVTLVGTIFAVI